MSMTSAHSFASIITGAESDDAQLRALEAAAREAFALPIEGSVVGEAVSLIAITYEGAPRAGLSARCVRRGREYSVALRDVMLPEGSTGARFVSAYRAWLGVAPASVGVAPLSRPASSGADIVIGEPIELVVLACKSNALRCRMLGSAREITLRTGVRDEVPGAIVRVMPTREWTHARHAYLAGSVMSMRMDAEALGLAPLALREEGVWDPERDLWLEEDEPLDDRTRAIIARGKRPRFEMEQVIPGADPDEPESDPIVEASELNAGGDHVRARGLLMTLLARDVRCIDAHAHLGNFAFDHSPAVARMHYEMGIGIAALSLGTGFDGVLPWALIDNRPLLRCLRGAALCAWRGGDFATAIEIFERTLTLDPGDGMGVWAELGAVRSEEAWQG